MISNLLEKLGPAGDLLGDLMGRKKPPDPITLAQGGFATPPAAGAAPMPQIPTATQMPRVAAAGQPFKWWEWMAGRGA